MLVKVNSIVSSGKRKRISGLEKGEEQEQYVRVTKLDIDDFGSIIPLKEFELRLPPNDESIAKTLRINAYAAVFTDDNNEERGSTIILANSITQEELNKEKEKTIDKVNNNKKSKIQ